MNYADFNLSSVVKLLMFIFFIPFVSHAQFVFPEVNTPDPMDKLKASFYPVAIKPVRKMTFIEAGDTTFVSTYNKDGRETLKINYKRNTPSSKLTYKYDGLNVETRYSGKSESPSDPRSRFRYDKNGNVVEWERLTESPIHWAFEYDAENRLTKKYTQAGNIKELQYEYHYDTAGKLTEVIQRQYRTQLNYEGKNLISKEVYYTNGGNTLNSLDRYACDAYGNLSMKVTKYDSTLYNFEGSDLKRMIIYKKDSTSEAVDFYYEKSMLQKVEITANTMLWGTWYRFPANCGNNGYAGATPVKRQIEFLYDPKGNIKEIKYFAEGKYLCNCQVIYEYY
jgi:YD repeat-containing protein